MPTPSRSVRGLAAGAALVSCSLASASNPPLMFSTLNSANGFISLGSTNGTFSYVGPSNGMNVSLTIGAGSGGGSATAGNDGAYFFPGYTDVFAASIQTIPASYTSGVAGVTFVVAVATAVSWNDYGIVSGIASSWTANSVGLTNGDLLGPGVYTFTGSCIYSGAALQNYTMGFFLSGASAAAVPLPGAAGLAAVGLAGAARRRRR